MLTAPPALDLLREYAERSALVVRAEGSWPHSTEDELPALPGFIDSTFSPLVAAAAHRCLRRAFGDPPVPAAAGERTAVVILSPLGDLASAREVARSVAAGARVGPLLFFQSVPHAVAGHVAARWGLAGPILCLSAGADGVDAVALLLADGDADEALVILAEREPDRAGAVLVREGRS